MNGDGTGYWSISSSKYYEAFERLAAIEDILGDDYDLDRLRELVEADRDGRCVVLPAKRIFEIVWDAGPYCDLVCPLTIDGEGQCDYCDFGKQFVYERDCKQEDIEQIGKTVFLTELEAEKALEGMQ